LLPPETEKLWRDDEGYVHLLKNAPSLEEMKAFFIGQRDQLEIEAAAEKLRKRQGENSRLS
jgi:hypothetical protein